MTERDVHLVLGKGGFAEVHFRLRGRAGLVQRRRRIVPELAQHLVGQRLVGKLLQDLGHQRFRLLAQLDLALALGLLGRLAEQLGNIRQRHRRRRIGLGRCRVLGQRFLHLALARQHIGFVEQGLGGGIHLQIRLRRAQGGDGGQQRQGDGGNSMRQVHDDFP